MVRWCIRLTRLTLVCEVIRYRLVQVRQNQKKKHLVACLGEKDVAALSHKNTDEDDVDREADEIEKGDPKVLETQTGSVQHSTPTLSRNNPETEMPAPGQMETDTCRREVDADLRPTKESAREV